ncbi:MAG: flagellin FliC [Pseudomonadaceae bacterium]|nr:flagellin FliC [Pseudomonadaceae bacterium]
MKDLFGNDAVGAAGDDTAAPVSGMQPLAKEFFGGTLTDTSKTTYTNIALSQMKISDHLSTMKEGDKVEIDGVTYARGTGNKHSSLQVTYKSNTVEMPNVFKDPGKVGLATAGVNPGDLAVLTGAASGHIDTLFGSASTKQNHMSDLLNRDLAATKTIDISNPDSARKAIDFTRESIDLISEIRATFGAVMNRFEAVISGNQTYAENLSAARSRIQDADFAVETAALAKQQVLQQAGVASLSQANASSQAILSLLG